jgi:protein-S-isoprenylcysteine O-methyltransferase Ste14
MTIPVETKPHRLTWHAGLALIYGAVCYLIFLFTTVYAVGFVGDIVVPKSLDSGRVVSPLQAIVIDVALLGLFALQHGIMARPAFKRWWTRFVPRPVERSTFVLFASLALLLLYWLWLPLPETIWNLSSPLVRYIALTLYGMGWLIVVLSSWLIDHSDLFGIRQVYVYFRGRDYTAPDFKTPTLYRLVRHPMMVGFLVAFWATPHLTVGHLLFSLAMTGYILAGVHFEERDLLAYYGETYQRYRQHVRMLIPFPKGWGMPADHGETIAKTI